MCLGCFLKHHLMIILSLINVKQIFLLWDSKNAPYLLFLKIIGTYL